MDNHHETLVFGIATTEHLQENMALNLDIGAYCKLFLFPIQWLIEIEICETAEQWRMFVGWLLQWISPCLFSCTCLMANYPDILILANSGMIRSCQIHTSNKIPLWVSLIFTPQQQGPHGSWWSSWVFMRRKQNTSPCHMGALGMRERNS